MELRAFAYSLLFATQLEEKLFSPAPDLLTDQDPGLPLGSVPPFPGRPPELSRAGKASFPDLCRIHEPIVRGEILHFFANHELLALELMALVLLRFPEAPSAFRMGIARTILEEQGHLRLYLGRMTELGVRFGDLPISDYFWKALSPMRSPMDFVTQMSLTFEQANLDFSLYYRNQVEKTGDTRTTEILDQVYREEIGHVKHGLVWFNRWRGAEEGGAPSAKPATESDWDAYRRLLPPPMNPRRAKGQIFCAESRREAGLSETFIRELELYSGTKGRPPILWLYNPFCDAEIARGKPGFRPKENLARLARDLEHVPLFLCSSQDTVLVTERPSLDWLAQLRDAGFEIPDGAPPTRRKLREPKFGGFEPWGWSPEVFEKFRSLQDRLIAIPDGNTPWLKTLFQDPDFERTGLSEIFSKTWSARFLETWLDDHPDEAQIFEARESVGKVFTEWTQAKAYLEKRLPDSDSQIASQNDSQNAAGHAFQDPHRQGPPREKFAAKAPWSTSGNGVRRVLCRQELDRSLGGWIRNTIETQGSIVIEPWLDKIHDLSIQIEVKENRIVLLEARKFLTGKQLEYRGTCLGPWKAHLDAESLRYLNQALPAWKRLARDLGQSLREKGYQGPAGIDAMIYRLHSGPRAGKLALKPLVELNPRWTMGRVALALEDQLVPGTAARWIFRPLKEFQQPPLTLLDEWMHSMPLKTVETAAGLRIASGLLPTQDPTRANEVLSLLLVGENTRTLW